jgi:hypothetical protein
VVLAFGGRHSYAVENLSAMVPKRLAKNAKLHRELAAGLAKSGGNSIPLDHLRVDKLFEMIAKGLAWCHWRVRLGKGHSAVASTFHDAGEFVLRPDAHEDEYATSSVRGSGRRDFCLPRCAS